MISWSFWSKNEERRKESIGVYVPGTTAFIQGEVGPEGGWVVVSWVPLRRTSVDLAASHPESSRVVPITAIASALDRVWLAHEWELFSKSVRTPGFAFVGAAVKDREVGGGVGIIYWPRGCVRLFLYRLRLLLLLCIAHKRRRFSSIYRQLLLWVYRIYNFTVQQYFPKTWITVDHPNRSSLFISTVQTPYP